MAFEAQPAFRICSAPFSIMAQGMKIPCHGGLDLGSLLFIEMRGRLVGSLFEPFLDFSILRAVMGIPHVESIQQAFQNQFIGFTEGFDGIGRGRDPGHDDSLKFCMVSWWIMTWLSQWWFSMS